MPLRRKTDGGIFDNHHCRLSRKNGSHRIAKASFEDLLSSRYRWHVPSSELSKRSSEELRDQFSAKSKPHAELTFDMTQTLFGAACSPGSGRSFATRIGRDYCCRCNMHRLYASLPASRFAKHHRRSRNALLELLDIPIRESRILQPSPYPMPNLENAGCNLL